MLIATDKFRQGSQDYKVSLVRDRNISMYQVSVYKLYKNGAPDLDFDFYECYKSLPLARQKYRKICNLMKIGKWDSRQRA